MKLLLDTHIWVWSLLEPEKLSRRVVKHLADRNAQLWLSPMSVWELLVLCEKGRVILEPDPAEWVKRALESAPLLEAPLTHEIALETVRVRLPHRDPCDHFLTATARVLGLTLITADQRLIESRACPVLANE